MAGLSFRPKKFQNSIDLNGSRAQKRACFQGCIFFRIPWTLVQGRIKCFLGLGQNLLFVFHTLSQYGSFYEIKGNSCNNCQRYTIFLHVYMGQNLLICLNSRERVQGRIKVFLEEYTPLLWK